MADLINAALQLVALALLTFGGLLVHRAADWLKLRADSEVRAYLMAGLDRAVEFGLAEARRRMANGQAEATDQRAIAEGQAALFTTQRFGDALARFGVDEAGLAQMIAARLPKLPEPGASFR